MKLNLKNQINIFKTRGNFKFAFSIMFIICLLSFIYNVIMYYGEYMPNVKSFRDLYIGTSTNTFSNIIVLLLPFIVVLPFCDSFIEDKHKNRLPIIFQLSSKKEYYLSKYIACGLAALIVTFFPLMLNLILNVIAFPSESASSLTGLASNQDWTYAVSSEFMTIMPFKTLFISYPFLYCIIYILFYCVYSVAGSLFTFSLAYYINNRILCILPFFVISTLTNILSSVFFNHFNIDLTISNYIISSNISEGINYIAFFIEILLFLIISIILLMHSIKDLRKCECVK